MFWPHQNYFHYVVKIASREITKMEKLAITTVSPSVEAFVNLRIYDGRTSSWFDNLSLPKPTHPYITRIIFTQWYTNHNTTKIGAIVPYFPPNHPKYRVSFYLEKQKKKATILFF